MACPIVVATMGTCGATVASSSKSAQTASAPPLDDLPLPRGGRRTAAARPPAAVRRGPGPRALGGAEVFLDEADRAAVPGADAPLLPGAGRGIGDAFRRVAPAVGWGRGTIRDHSGFTWR